jgi:hypothetical protein
VKPKIGAHAFLLSLAFSCPAFATDITIPGEFRYVWNGNDLGPTPDPDSLAKDIPDGLARQDYVDALRQVAQINERFSAPMRAALQRVKAAQAMPNQRYQQAKRAAAEAQRLQTELKASAEWTNSLATFSRVGMRSGTNPHKNWLAWRENIKALATATAEAQKVPREIRQPAVTQARKMTGSIDSALSAIRNVRFESILTAVRKLRDYVSSSSGVALQGVPASSRLLSAARGLYDGHPYEDGYKCSNLVINAAEKAGLEVVTSTVGDRNERPTTKWFKYGMGPDFKQVVGDTEGITLTELRDRLHSSDPKERIELPPGAVIVAPGVGSGSGHAAFFQALIQTKPNQWQILIYDSNAYKGSFTHTIFPPGNTGEVVKRVYPGNRTGEHVAPSQWNPDQKIKVFVPTR